MQDEIIVTISESGQIAFPGFLLGKPVNIGLLLDASQALARIARGQAIMPMGPQKETEEDNGG